MVTGIKFLLLWLCISLIPYTGTSLSIIRVQIWTWILLILYETIDVPNNTLFTRDRTDSKRSYIRMSSYVILNPILILVWRKELSLSRVRWFSPIFMGHIYRVCFYRGYVYTGVPWIGAHCGKVGWFVTGVLQFPVLTLNPSAFIVERKWKVRVRSVGFCKERRYTRDVKFSR